jgi:NADH-quinone oxidoreductase subunit L
VQTDIKRILAYSTISQIGYMFLALGVGAWAAAIFHFMTHAFFKSTLFMAAGVVINALDHEHDIFRMGGLRHRLPWAFGSFVVSGASLAAVPLVTAGFYSKDLILWRAWNGGAGGVWLWLAGMVGALLTALYIFRLIFVVFFGEMRTAPTLRPNLPMKLPLAVLSALSLVAGFLDIPSDLGGSPLFSSFVDRVLPAFPETGGSVAAAILQFVAAAVSLGGIYIAWSIYGPAGHLRALRSAGPTTGIGRFWLLGWGFDTLYGWLVVTPFVAIARINAGDVIDLLYRFIAYVSRGLHFGLSASENGRLRRYAAGIAAGSIALVAIMVFA